MSYSIDVFNKEWKKVKNIKLDSELFNDDNINMQLIHQYLRMQRNNGRIAIAHTKTRWDVQWSWKKLYRQKWMWAWRVWEKRSPLRRKWWVVFGPTKFRNFSIDMPKKARRKAMLWLLISKLKEGNVVWLEKFDLKEIKTKKAVEVLNNIWLWDTTTLVILSDNYETTTRSLANVKWVKYILYNYLNPYDVLTHKKILLEEDVISKIEDYFRKK